MIAASRTPLGPVVTRARAGRRVSPKLATGAFTLIETLVVVGIVGLLAALIVPAVQSSRRAAQRLACGNNIRQLALGVQNYHSAFNVFPAATGLPDYEPGLEYREIRAFKQYSYIARILPYIDQGPLYDDVNFLVGLQDFYIFPLGPGLTMDDHPNHTVLAARLASALCPADPGAGEPGWTGGANYRANLGADRWPTFMPSPLDGPMMSYSYLSSAATTDGLSRTVMLSEKLRGAVRKDIHPRTVMIRAGRGLPYSVDESVADCRSNASASRAFHPTAGLSWSIGTLSHTCYNHALAPNGAIPDCFMASNPVAGLFGARSNHPGGVMAAFADGSATFVRSGIDLRVWRALGTRAGGEAIGEGDF